LSYNRVTIDVLHYLGEWEKWRIWRNGNSEQVFSGLGKKESSPNLGGSPTAGI
jgi:hypothetical protein